MEREEGRGREAVGAGAAGSQRASRSGLLSRGTVVMSPPVGVELDVNLAPLAPEPKQGGRTGKMR